MGSGHTVIYALGGGRGHLQRALNLAARQPGPCAVLHQAAGPVPDTVRSVPLGPCTVAHAQQALAQALVGAHTLIVDTFPGGIAHELRLPQGPRTVLVARALQRAAYPDYDVLAARYDEVWLPYEPQACEWEDPPVGRWIGPVSRPITWRGQVDLLVIGAGEPPTWTPLLAGAHRVDGPFTALPRAQRTVALSAGYNLTHELLSLGIRPALRPLPRRFDDQFARAARHGHPLHHRRDLQRYLEAPCS